MNLFLSRQDGAAWQTPIELGPSINTPANELSASLSPDGRSLFFASNRRPPARAEPRTKPVTRADIEAESRQRTESVLNGKGNLYQVDMATVNTAISEAKDGGQQ
jgi:Tol biopolymer transport system component